MTAKKLFFKETHLAGAMYHDLDEVFDELKVGTTVKLVRDKENAYDHNAVAVVYTKGKEDYLLGFIPRSENEFLASMLDMGWGCIFRCSICQINPDSHYENQVHLKISILRNPKAAE